MKTAILFLIIAFAACSTDTEYSEMFSPVIEVEDFADNIPVNEPLEITVVHQGNDGCAEYSRHEVNYGDTTTIRFYQKSPTYRACTDALIQIKTTISLQFEESGLHILKFVDDFDGKDIIDSVFVIP